MDSTLALHKMSAKSILSGPDEGKMGLFPWQDRWKWDIGNPGATSFDFASVTTNKSYHATISPIRDSPRMSSLS